jgi:hypothetical protein
MSTAQPSRPPRWSVRLAAELRVGSVTAAGATRDVSSGGVCVELARLFAEGTAVEVVLFVVEDDIESVDQRTLVLAATVQWTAEAETGYAHGLKFVETDANKLTALANALRALGLGS